MSAEESQEDAEAQHQDHGVQSTPLSSNADAQPTGDERKNSKCSPEKWWHNPEWWIVVFEGFLLPVGIAALIIYSGQLDEMKKSTVAATKATELATVSSHLDLRAWVAPDAIRGKPALNQVFDITVDVRNAGKTFAKNFTGVVAAKPKELADPDPDFDAELLEIGGSFNKTLLAPAQPISYTLHVYRGEKITQEYMDQIRNPAFVLLVFGKLVYSDIFGCQHWTKFCYRGTADGEYFHYGPYNDADNNCGPEVTPTDRK